MLIYTHLHTNKHGPTHLISFYTCHVEWIINLPYWTIYSQSTNKVTSVRILRQKLLWTRIGFEPTCAQHSGLVTITLTIQSPSPRNLVLPGISVHISPYMYMYRHTHKKNSCHINNWCVTSFWRKWNLHIK